MKNETRCSHSAFYTMYNAVYCNNCHTHLGYFDPVVLCGFVKKTKDTISEKYLNEKTVSQIFNK